MKSASASYPKGPMDWLLEPQNPSVRYFTLRWLLEKKESDSEVAEARKGIMTIGPVPKILSYQKPEGYWGQPEDFYVRSKYKGTVWSFLLLAQLGADGKDSRIMNARDAILRLSQERKSGGFSHRGTEKAGGTPEGIIPCLTGNMLWSMLKFGYIDHPGVKKGLEFITTYMRFDDGAEEAPKGWPYERYKNCWGTHTCHMGCFKMLKALSAIPPTRRSSRVKDLIETGTEHFLKHRIFKRSSDPSRVAKAKWLRLSFPYLWQYDVLEVLNTLIELGCKDERMIDAIELVRSKQGKDGKWIIEETYNGRFLTVIEPKGKPSKWLTLLAMRMMKARH
jgi:hypothetical protein